jgi:hypothetical protein
MRGCVGIQEGKREVTHLHARKRQTILAFSNYRAILGKCSAEWRWWGVISVREVGGAPAHGQPKSSISGQVAPEFFAFFHYLSGRTRFLASANLNHPGQEDRLIIARRAVGLDRAD